MPDQPDPARQEVERALADCQGDRDAALLLLGYLLTEAKRGLSAGLRRLPPADRPTGGNRVTAGL